MEHGLVHVLAQLHQDEPVAEPQLFHHYTKCKKLLEIFKSSAKSTFQIYAEQKYFVKLSYPKRCPHDSWTWLGPRKQHSGST
jgi:hypothetical protein